MIEAVLSTLLLLIALINSIFNTDVILKVIISLSVIILSLVIFVICMIKLYRS